MNMCLTSLSPKSNISLELFDRLLDMEYYINAAGFLHKSTGLKAPLDQYTCPFKHTNYSASFKNKKTFVHVTYMSSAGWQQLSEVCSPSAGALIWSLCGSEASVVNQVQWCSKTKQELGASVNSHGSLPDSGRPTLCIFRCRLCTLLR